jgi:dihydroorotate dehydrogenase (NAD+) catalytic subunit
MSANLPRQELYSRSPWLVAGLGFAPAAALPVLPEPPGAFITAPISIAARTPAESRACLSYPGGFLLHTGLPNPGLRAILKHYAARWERSGLPIWPHLIPATPDEAGRMSRLLEGRENVTALVISPPLNLKENEQRDLLAAARGELPIIVEIPLSAISAAGVEILAGLGISAIIGGAPRGCLPAADGTLVGGRLFGPGLLPQTLEVVRLVKRAGLPIIAAAGVFSAGAGTAALTAGAWAVALDVVLWRPGALGL